MAISRWYSAAELDGRRAMLTAASHIRHCLPTGRGASRLGPPVE